MEKYECGGRGEKHSDEDHVCKLDAESSIHSTSVVWQTLWQTTSAAREGTYAERSVRTFAWTVALENGHNCTRPIEIIIRELPNATESPSGAE